VANKKILLDIAVLNPYVPQLSGSGFRFYRAFHGFEQAKIGYGGLVLGLSQFPLLPWLPQKMKLASKVVTKS